LHGTDAQHHPGVLRIFISYRRQDAPSYARELYHELSSRFPDSQIFWDIKMELGVDFVEEIERAVGSCDVLVAVVGPHWLSVADDQGQRRLDDPADFVRLEIATALERNIRVIPVLVQGASMPPAETLPDALQRLARRSAIELSDKRWDYDMGELIASLQRVPYQKLIPPTGRGSFPSEDATPQVPTAQPTARTNTPAVVLRSNAQPSSTAETRTPTVPHSRPNPTNLPLLLGGVAALVVVAVGVFFLLRQPVSPPAPTAAQTTVVPTVAQAVTVQPTRANSQPTQPAPTTNRATPPPTVAQAVTVQPTRANSQPTQPASTANRATAVPTVADANYADELTDFGVPEQSLLQTQDNIGTETPTSIPGGDVVTTSELAGGLQQARGTFLLIDALAGSAHASIPDALWVPTAGDSGTYNDSVQQSLTTYYGTLTQHNFDAVMVFFCQGALCWESYNASLRAIHMGYTRVYWYRGGLAAWKAAGLPMTTP
jgi:PQQ-dependent catabolism-associated CXXCW motif protein